MASYAYPDVLVETQWVADHLDDPIVRLIEAAYDTEKYDLEHIPGALAWTWKQDFQHPVRELPVAGKACENLHDWQLCVQSGVQRLKTAGSQWATN